MELIRKDEVIVLMDDKNEIETYAFDKEINFRGLIDYLLGFNLSKSMEINDNIKDKSEAEENLVNIINDLLEDYNSKVKEMEVFIKDLSNN